MKFPVAPLRNDYELVMQIDYLADPRYLSIVFPVGGRMCGWAFAGSDDADGLELVDGKYAKENVTTVKPTLLKKGRRFLLRITVDVQDDQGQIVVYIDRTRYTGWKGKLASLDLNNFGFPNLAGHINIEQADASSIVVQSASLLNK